MCAVVMVVGCIACYLDPQANHPLCLYTLEVDGAMIGGIIGGVEFFGPAAVRSQFRRHTLHRTTTSTPAASLIEATRTWLDANEPDFLPTGSPDLAYRTTVDVTGACADGVEAHDPCSGVDEFGDVCDSGDTLLLCNKGRDGSGAAWFPIGSSQACTTQIADDLCTEAGETCLNGIDVLTCTEAGGGPDSIPMWSPETSVYGDRPLDANDFANGLHPWATP